VNAILALLCAEAQTGDLVWAEMFPISDQALPQAGSTAIAAAKKKG
jgi:hypothetical protein